MTTPTPKLSPEEQRLRNRSILLAIVCPVALAVWFPDIGDTAIEFVSMAVLFALPVYVLLRPFYRWIFEGGSFLRFALEDVRVGLPFTPVDGKLAPTTLPWVTLGLIASNVAIFLAGADPWDLAISSFDPTSWVYTNWTSMFGHADGEHLLGNMIFLWIFGAALEHRIGPINFLFDYLVMGTVANAIGMTGFALFGEESISLGASGAIAGVMGIYLVRCYFNRIPIGVPILVPMGPTGPLVFAVRFNAVALLTFFFLLDLLGVREQLAGSASPIGYWAHLGGYFCGLSIGYSRRYYRDGLREELAARMQTGPRDGDFGRRRGARDTLLELSPDHPDALLCRARDGSRFQRREDAADDYVRLIHLLLGSDRRRAGTIFLEYFHKYLRPLTLDRQLAVTPELAARGEIDLAARCLDLAAREADADPELRARATAYEAKLLSRLGLLQAPEPQDRATREAPEN